MYNIDELIQGAEWAIEQTQILLHVLEFSKKEKDDYRSSFVKLLQIAEFLNDYKNKQ